VGVDIHSPPLLPTVKGVAFSGVEGMGVMTSAASDSKSSSGKATTGRAACRRESVYRVRYGREGLMNILGYKMRSSESAEELGVGLSSPCKDPLLHLERFESLEIMFSIENLEIFHTVLGSRAESIAAPTLDGGDRY